MHRYLIYGYMLSILRLKLMKKLQTINKTYLLIGILVVLLSLGVLGVITLVWAGTQVSRMIYVDRLVRPKGSFPLSLKWQVDLGIDTYQEPVFSQGLVLMPVDNRWYGLNAATGEIVWSQRISHSFFRCLTPEYLAISGTRSLTVLEAQTGRLVWGSDYASYSTSCSQEVLFSSGSPRDPITAYDLLTGQTLWGSTTPPETHFTGVIYDSETNLLLARTGNKFYHIYPTTGRLIDSFEQVAPAPSNGSDGRGPLYVIDNGELFIGGTVQDAQTGQVIHKEDRFGTGVPPVVTDDTMYLSALYHGVVAFDRTTYDIKWIYPSPKEKLGSVPLITLSQIAMLDGTGYVIFSDATVHAFDLEIGEEMGYWQPSEEVLWEWPVCTPQAFERWCVKSARAGLAASDDTLFVSLGDGRLYAFSR